MTARLDPYPSRTGEEERILPRIDPVTYASSDSTTSPAPLGPQQLARYTEKGFLVLPGLFRREVAAIRREVDDLGERLRGNELLYTEPDSEQPRTIFKPFAHSALIDGISRDPRILETVQQLLGSAVYLMQSRINVKPAFRGRSFAWHSDFETWHVEDGMPRMRALTAWIMLDHNTPFNGPLYVIPGSHRMFIACAGRTGRENYRSSLKQQTLGVPRNATMREVLRERQIESICGEPGTLVIHECNLLHGSPDNISADPRSILMFVYNSVENRPGEPYSGLPPRPHYLSNPDTTALRPLPSSNDADYRAREYA